MKRKVVGLSYPAKKPETQKQRTMRAEPLLVFFPLKCKTAKFLIRVAMPIQTQT